MKHRIRHFTTKVPDTYHLQHPPLSLCTNRKSHQVRPLGCAYGSHHKGDIREAKPAVCKVSLTGVNAQLEQDQRQADKDREETRLEKH